MKQDEFDRLYQSSRFAQQVTAELLHGVENGVGLIVGALARQMDPALLAEHLRAQIYGAKKIQSMSGLPVQIATHALKAAEAEIALRNAPEGPKRQA